MKRLYLGLALAALVVLTGSQANARSIKDTRVIRPAKHVRHDRKFHPVEHPDPSKVPWIENKEQKRWGGPSLHRRSYCESGNRWWASPAGVLGIIERGWWYGTALPATPRKVTLHHTFERWRPVHRLVIYSDGTKRLKRIGRMRQKVRLVRHGSLADGDLRDSTPQSTWLAIRVSQRAVSGDGPPASWQCSL